MRRRRARVWVDDEGEGIPARERERVFESFYRLDRHANSAVAGSGIGLYVVRELARLHGGDAWAEEAPRGGARVVIELPAAEPSPGFTDEHASARRAPRSRDHDAHSRHRGQQESRDRAPKQSGDRGLRGARRRRTARAGSSPRVRCRPISSCSI